MNKFDIMREKISIWSREARQDMRQFITDYEELVKDVKRFIELQSKVYKLYNATENEANDLVGLLNKLSKVGVSDD